MKRLSLLLTASSIFTLGMISCEKEAAKPTQTPAPEAAKPQTEAAKKAEEVKPASAPVSAPAPTPTAAVPTETFNPEKFPEAVDIGDFGSDEPMERADMPQRGIIVMGADTYQRTTMAHWEQFDWKTFKPKRFGRYTVRLTYSLNHANLGIQFRLGDLMVKKPLSSSLKPRKTYLGEVYIEKAEEMPFSMLAAATATTAGFKVQELALIPTPETAESVTQADDGSVTLLAKNATTWSETMRYEPKPEKNCLGYWTDPEDFAEWEFEVKKPGRFKVAVFQGCGGGNAGSEVEVKSGSQALKFVVEDTGGFQNWKEVAVGEIEVKAAGVQRLVIDPINKVKSAVLDVQKVVLTPAS